MMLCTGTCTYFVDEAGRLLITDPRTYSVRLRLCQVDFLPSRAASTNYKFNNTPQSPSLPPHCVAAYLGPGQALGDENHEGTQASWALQSAPGNGRRAIFHVYTTVCDSLHPTSAAPSPCAMRGPASINVSHVCGGGSRKSSPPPRHSACLRFASSICLMAVVVIHVEVGPR